MKDGHDKVNHDWDWMKDKCLDCWKKNRTRTIHKDWNSYHIKLCKFHQNTYNKLRLEILGRTHKEVKLDG